MLQMGLLMEHFWENLLRRAAVPDFTLGGEGAKVGVKTEAGNQGDWGSLIFNKDQIEESMVLPSRKHGILIPGWTRSGMLKVSLNEKLRNFF